MLPLQVKNLISQCQLNWKVSAKHVLICDIIGHNWVNFIASLWFRAAEYGMIRSDVYIIHKWMSCIMNNWFPNRQVSIFSRSVQRDIGEKMAIIIKTRWLNNNHQRIKKLFKQFWNKNFNKLITVIQFSPRFNTAQYHVTF